MRHHLAPVLGLFLLAPWVGEYLLGNIPLEDFIAIPFLAPLYGGGALLIREITRRTGRGWPTILLLGMAYGLIQAGLVDQSLFNPSFEGHEFQEVTPIPALGISAYHATTFIIGHAVWSIGIPIAMVEVLTPARRTTPWLGNGGLAITVVLYLIGCWIIFIDLLEKEGFLASPIQMAGVAAVALALITLAFTIRIRKHSTIFNTASTVPGPPLLGTGAFVVAGVYTARPENWFGVGLAIVMICIVALLIFHWSGQREWSLKHEFALMAGGLLTYVWLGFVLTSIVRPDNNLAWAGNVIFAIIAIVLLIVAQKAVERQVHQGET